MKISQRMYRGTSGRNVFRSQRRPSRRAPPMRHSRPWWRALWFANADSRPLSRSYNEIARLDEDRLVRWLITPITNTDTVFTFYLPSLSLFFPSILSYSLPYFYSFSIIYLFSGSCEYTKGKCNRMLFGRYSLSRQKSVHVNVKWRNKS